PAQIVAGGHEVGEIADRAHPPRDTLCRDHLFGEVTHGAVLGAGAVAVEPAGGGMIAEFRPRLLHAPAIRRKYTLRPGIGTMAYFQAEHAAVLRIGIGHVAGGVRVIDRD